ncbi:hypothetical protein LZP73_08815 [Shewanella sp. AS16]|uniref:hypothetical protein n=1 Tax=Shewanella sp. AS16 TaxID=2907625 RepID=UPI001F2E64CD|nr:hypothetical protein [Shewanella sp. AS16]MCE9686311.1 hypothetical protein [Shewanella sp. AS16]
MTTTKKKALTGRTRQIDPRQLVLDNKFQGRQVELNNSRQDKAAIERSRQMQIDIILADLRAGKGIRNKIQAFELEGKLCVVDGFHRTEACKQYLKESPEANLTVPVKVYKDYSESQAYFFSLTANRQHGTALSASERMQNQFKREVMLQHYEQVPSKRELAKLYSCQDSQGLHVQRALKACMGEGRPSKQEWSTDLEGAIEQLQASLKSEYPALRDDDFDKDGFPIIRRLSDATTKKGDEYDYKDEDPEEYERKMVTYLARKLEDMIANEGGERFRAALKRLDRNALGISVKREWDEDKVVLTYPTKDAELF